MSERKVTEFRERALVAVTPPDPDQLLERGRALRRRRRLAPVVAVAVAAAVAFGLFTVRGYDRSQPPPATQVTQSSNAKPPLLGAIGVMGGQTYGVDTLYPDNRADFLVDLVGDGNWKAWSGGAWMTSPQGTVSWGVGTYAGTIIDRCRPGQHAKTRAGAITQLSHIDGTVTKAAQPARKLGMTGTHIQVRVPVDHLDCPSGVEPGVEPSGHNLMAIWDGGSTAPTVTVDVWLLGDGKDMIILTRGVRGTPPAEMLESLDKTVDTLRPAHTP
jgi:hypothetical protein